MNYFAHGRDFIEEPYFLAGTAVPDWLNVADRRVRARARQARALVAHADPRVAAVARGIVQHHHDDAWFHATPAFHQLCGELALLVRQALPGDEGLRPGFLAHILVEILLDDVLIRNSPPRLHSYYAALERVEPRLVEQAVNAVAARQTARLAPLIPHFCRERFLWDYLDDGKLWYRLNQVMRRVGLPLLAEAFGQVLQPARRLVSTAADALLTPPPTLPPAPSPATLPPATLLETPP